MRMTGKFVLLLAAMLALFLGQAQAQRCLPGMKGVQLMADMVDGFIAGRNVMIRDSLSDLPFLPMLREEINGHRVLKSCGGIIPTVIHVSLWSSILRKAATITISFPTQEKCISEYWCFRIDGV